MLKRLSMVLSLLLLAGTAFSQVVWRYGAAIDSGWGEAGCVCTPYVEFPTTFTAPYAGCQLTTVRIGLKAQATNVYVYIKQKAQDAQPIYRQKVGTLQPGWNDVVLETPYNITGEPVAIGYKASFAADGGVGVSQEKFADGDIVYYNSQNRWTSTGASIALQALIVGDALPENELMIGQLQNQTAPYEASTVSFRSTVRNVGGNDIARYRLAYTLDGGEQQILDMEHPVAVNATDSFDISVPATVVGQHQLRVWIDQTNGAPDAYAPNNEATAILTVKDPAFQRHVVCEEYTGNWCGWCPRGMVGLELMKDYHPTSFIPVSIHGSSGSIHDPLEIDASLSYTYKPFIAEMTGAPSCMMDRKLSGDPFYDIQNLYSLEQTADALAAINTTAEWQSGGAAIVLHTEWHSAADISQADYNIAYVITEDSLTGYNQANYYSGGGNGAFYGWEQKGNPTKDYVCNDVARGIFPSYAGEEAHSGQLIANEAQAHDYVLTIPSNVTDKARVKVTTLLVDRQTGYIVNACRTTPDDAQTGVTLPSTSRNPHHAAVSYTLTGQSSASSRRGLSIEMGADGKWRKIVRP